MMTSLTSHDRLGKYGAGPMSKDEGQLQDDCVVSLEGVVIGYDSNNPLLKVPDLTIKSGEIVAITGSSGVGKTTLLRTIAGLIRPISGTLRVCHSTLPSKPPRGSVGYIPQRLGLVKHASVRHNVMLGARAGHTNPLSLFPSSEAIEHTDYSIERMGLTDKANEPIRRLSGGQQRRVATARTLAQNPKLIMADEFLSELDEETLEKVLSEVTGYVRSSGAALIVVEHDFARAKSMADRLLLIDDGRVNPFLSETTAVEVKI